LPPEAGSIGSWRARTEASKIGVRDHFVKCAA
jgi:hypothetical protein